MSCTKNTKEGLNWQYKQEFHYGALPEEALQRYREYGWELVTVVPMPRQEFLYIFKRPRNYSVRE